MDGFVIIGTELETKNFDKQIEDLENKLDTLEKEYEVLEKASPYKGQEEDLIKIRSQIEKTKNSIIGLRKQQLKLNENNFFQNASSSLDGILKKVAKWGLALFGIRSAYSFISRSMSTLSQYNEQIGTDLSYIKFAMATALEPLIETIIQLAYKLLGIINSISIALFNVDLFANASADRFKSMSKSANQIKKSLAGFDEMNIIQDNSASGGGGVSSPSVDLSKLNDTKAGEEFKSFWKGIIDFWEKDWEKAFDNIGGMWGTFFKGIGLIGKGFYDIFKGIIDILIGLWNMLVGVFTGNTEKMKEGWNKFVKGIKEIFVGLIEIIIGLVVSIVGTILGLLKEFVGTIWNILKSIWNGIVSIFSGTANWIYTKIIQPIANFFANLWNGIINSAKNGISNIKSSWNSFVSFISNITAGIKNFFTNAWNNIVSGAKNAWNGVKNVFGGITSFFSNIINNILNLFKNIGTKTGQVVSSAFKSVINAVLRTLESILNTPIRAINAIIDKARSIPGIGKLLPGKLSAFSLPRLAKGGIVNMPGRGVNYAGTNIAEKRPEGIIPLTDSQQMEWLGREIGKNVVINTTIVNSMNGRVISRELQKIQNEDSFAFNR